MSAPAVPATAHIPTVGMTIEMPAHVAPWDLVVVLADALDLLTSDVTTDVTGPQDEDETALMTVSSEDHARMLIVAAAPDAVRLRLLVTAPDHQAREVLAGALDALTGWAEAAGVTGWRWTADGCTGWHCTGPSCPAAAPATPARWRVVLADVIASVGLVAAQLSVTFVALFALLRHDGTGPTPANTFLAGWPYAAGDLAIGLPVALAAYAAHRVLDAVAALIDPPDEGRLAAACDAVGPVVVAVAGALLGWGWLA